jgi:hypothetical protein
MAMFWKKMLIAGVLAVFVALSGGTVMAATITDFVSGNPVYAPDQENQVFVISNKLDFGDIDDYPGSGVTTGDVVQLLDVPAGMIVNAVGVHIYSNSGTVAATTVSASTVGDGSDADGWITDVDLAPSASGVSSTYEDGISGAYQTTYGGKYYSSADTIDITIGTVAGVDYTSGVTGIELGVWAEGIMAPTKEHYGTLR